MRYYVVVDDQEFEVDIQDKVITIDGDEIEVDLRRGGVPELYLSLIHI